MMRTEQVGTDRIIETLCRNACVLYCTEGWAKIKTLMTAADSGGNHIAFAEAINRTMAR